MDPDVPPDDSPPGGRAEERSDAADAADDDSGVPLSLYVRDVATSVGAVALVGLLLFAVSGVWPPLVAIESGSMTPNIDTGDMVFIMAEDRFPGPDDRHGVVTAEAGSESNYVMFRQPGDVIVFEPNGNEQRTPVIHRAMFYVTRGENWYDRADPDDVGRAESCADLRNCPAPHDGFVTKGDFNDAYDQATGTSTVVRAEWVVGTAEFRVPGLGWVRLQSGHLPVGPRPTGA